MEDWVAGMQEDVFEEFGFGMEALADNFKQPFTEQLCINIAYKKVPYLFRML